MKPRVIWLDDDIKKDSLRATVIMFKKKFDVIECETIDEFYSKSRTLNWDAAILDVLNSREQSADVYNSINTITREFPDKKWFVFSGKDRITKDDSDVKATLEGDSYIRNYATKTIYVKSEDEQVLLEDITNAVQSSRKWAVEEQYEKVLDIVSNRLNHNECRNILLDILCSIGGAKTINGRLYYNSIRIVLEWMFRAANKAGLLHDKCFDSRDHINLTDSSLFMAGLPAIHSGVICSQTHFPCLVAKNVKFILDITGGASHTTEIDMKDNPNLTAYWDTVDSPYLLYSLAYMLCDILIWFDQYIERHCDVAANKALWRSLQMDGELEQDDANNYSVGDCLIPYRVVQKQSLTLGDHITVTECVMTDAEKNVAYPVTAMKVEKRR